MACVKLTLVMVRLNEKCVFSVIQLWRSTLGVKKNSEPHLQNEILVPFKGVFKNFGQTPPSFSQGIKHQLFN